jgi:hypothetical protein
VWSEAQEARTNHRIIMSPHINHTTLPTLPLLLPQSPLVDMIVGHAIQNLHDA